MIRKDTKNNIKRWGRKKGLKQERIFNDIFKNKQNTLATCSENSERLGFKKIENIADTIVIWIIFPFIVLKILALKERISTIKRGSNKIIRLNFAYQSFILYLNANIIPFKVFILGSYTPVVALFPVLITMLEGFNRNRLQFHHCAPVGVIDSPKMTLSNSYMN